MARVTVHSLLKELRGNVNGLVIRKIRGQYFLGRKPEPDPRRKPTPDQLEFRRRFRLASEYAKGVQRSAEQRAFYEPFAVKRDLRIRGVAISDWFNAPVVNTIELAHYHGRVGDVITIRASDEFGVVRVAVTLRKADGTALEAGDARLAGKAWRYTATRAVPAGQRITVHARAYDRPGQSGEKNAEWPAR